MGFFRLALALCVIGSHTGYILWVDGRSAVFIFYIISGYLITKVLNEVYTTGATYFYINRALRIFVPAAVVFVLSCLLYLTISASFPPLTADFTWVKIYSIVSGLTIFLQDLAFIFGVDGNGYLQWQPFGGDETRVVSLSRYQYNGPLFTVAIELYFYIIAPFIVRRPSGALALAWIGFVYHALTKWLGIYSITFNYHIFLATWFYFGSGAVCYWLHRSESRAVTASCYLTLIVFCVFLLRVRGIGSPEMYLACILALPALIQVSRKVALDAYVGHYSYLIYVTHIPVMQFYSHVVGVWPRGRSSFWIVVIASVALAATLHHAIENPVEMLRKRIRAKTPLALVVGRWRLPIGGRVTGWRLYSVISRFVARGKLGSGAGVRPASACSSSPNKRWPLFHS